MIRYNIEVGGGIYGLIIRHCNYIDSDFITLYAICSGSYTSWQQLSKKDGGCIDKIRVVSG